VRVQVVGGSNTVYYLHSDHLGSTTALSSCAAAGPLTPAQLREVQRIVAGEAG
jgi:hypothetical protein